MYTGIVLALSLLFVSFYAVAQHAPALVVEPDEVGPRPQAPQLDRSRDWLAHRIEAFSGRLDNFFIEKFFGDEVLDDHIEGSRALISLHTRREIGGDVEYLFDARVKIVLPKTDERLKLLISSEDESEYGIEQDPVQNVGRATYSTGLRYLWLESRKWSSDFDAGVRWRAPPDPYMRNRFRRQFNLGNWRTYFTQSFFYYVLDGTGERTDLYSDLAFSDKKLLRVATMADYRDKNGYFDVSHSVTLYHKLENKAAFAYFVGATGDTETGAVFKNYYAGMRYRRLIYKDWIFAEINPQQEWSSDNLYHRQAVLMFRLEAMIE